MGCTLKSKEWDPGKLVGGFMENLQPFLMNSQMEIIWKLYGNHMEIME